MRFLCFLCKFLLLIKKENLSITVNRATLSKTQPSCLREIKMKPRNSARRWRRKKPGTARLLVINLTRLTGSKKIWPQIAQ